MYWSVPVKMYALGLDANFFATSTMNNGNGISRIEHWLLGSVMTIFVYIKNYFDEYFVLLQASEDVPVLMRIFYHGRYFSNFIDDYISVLKKKAKKETERWKRILGWTCVYLVTAERSDQAAEELYKPIVRYLRSLDEDGLLDVRQAVIKDIPSSRCDYLFDEVRRKEGLAEKLGGFFHKK